MGTTKNMEAVESNARKPVKDRFPNIVLFIIITEFCERFSYSGMKAFLTLYLRSKLGYTDDEATETYHVFTTFVYVFPIIGGIVADNYLGKYRTILYMMFVYATGNTLVAVTAIPQLGLPGRACTLLGLFMITVGTGGIKPCVTAFGGDQFKLPEQERHLAMYFSILYFNICCGALIAKTVSPILRSEIHCFGEKDCYSVAFGAPGLVMLMSVVIFVSARSRYVIKKPEGNVILDFITCICLGLKNVVIGNCKREKNSHWLDTTENKFDKRFIKDIKRTLSILTLFSVLPVFWSLLDQMGSRWTLQATKMDGRLGFLTIKPDQMQVLSPIGILILIPLAAKALSLLLNVGYPKDFYNDQSCAVCIHSLLAHFTRSTFHLVGGMSWACSIDNKSDGIRKRSYIYPFLEKRNILNNPLHKLTLGGVFAGVAFIMSASVEIYISTTYPQLPTLVNSQLRVFNGNNCSISLQNSSYNISYAVPPLSVYTNKDFKVHNLLNIEIDVNGSCIEARKEKFLLEENSAVSFFIDGGDVHRFEDKLQKSRSGLPVVRFLVSQRTPRNVSLVQGSTIETQVSTAVSSQTEVFVGKYNVMAEDGLIATGVELLSGGVYTIMVDKDNDQYKSSLIVLTEANSITMAWLLPQYIVMAAAEALFAVTGNEFAFKEAPDSMKAVMTASWLLTEAVGNVIIIVITRLMSGYRQETQFFTFTGMIFVTMVVFHFLCKGYKFSSEEDPRKECRSNSEVLYLQVKQTEDCVDH